jgi:hypothetical protein
MKIVIDIPKKTYNEIKEGTMITCGETFAKKLVGYIRNGTPLPEHHGDLVDRDAIEVLRIRNIEREYDKGFDAGVSCMVNRILETPTIIEGSESE